jgi:hypothetical protein
MSYRPTKSGGDTGEIEDVGEDAGEDALLDGESDPLILGELVGALVLDVTCILDDIFASFSASLAAVRFTLHSLVST